MNEPYKLLVIDNDFHAYSTPNSLNLAIDLLRNEGKRWAYYLHLQTDGVKALEQNGYNAVLIDNDFGEGMNSLDKIIQTFVSRVPIAYISAYTPEALRIQARELCERGKTGIFPEEFERSGVILIRKPGRNISKEISQEELSISLAYFLRSACS